MSSTRHAPEGAPLSQDRYMSSPEYAELRGVSGSAVTAKACYLQRADQRALLYFLQAMSLRDGGLKKLAKEIIDASPERIGTPEMHAAGLGENKIYSLELLSRISQTIHHGLLYEKMDDWYFDFASDEQPKPACQAVQTCRSIALNHLSYFLMDLCINPRREVFDREGKINPTYQIDREAIREKFPNLTDHDFRGASVPYFRGIIGALFDYMGRYILESAESIAETSISAPVFTTLDKCLQTRKMVVVQGNSRLGKSTAAEAWYNMHLGEARYISLVGICNRTGFFRILAKALGIASSFSRKSNEMQMRVEDMLQRSKLMLIIDEAHYLFPQQKRVYTAPELVDWVNTALCNYKVPVALVCTPQLAYRRMEVEKQTGWNSEQFRGRIAEYKILPQVPTQSDLEAVAKKRLPAADKASIQLIVGYAIASKGYMPAVVDTIDEAKIIAGKAGRENVRFEDIDKAINDYRISSDTAQAAAFELPEEKARRKRNRPDPAPRAEKLPEGDSQAEGDLFTEAETPLQEPFTMLEKTPTKHPGGRQNTLQGVPAVRPPGAPVIPDPERSRISQEAVLQG